MNNARIWLVVKPTVGLPLFLGGVALTALGIHVAVLAATDWYPAYWNGGPTAAQTVVAPVAAEPASLTLPTGEQATLTF
ncbi:light-harvesting protein B-800-850 alpha chain [Rhodobium orientis]|uniref:Antenna complex alpha/beta subunit domain-containing protein n=1 Tax=Rhodobium orientis TaxID=34017 RepID=A0A327JP41_9HYPH|nr:MULTISPECIES: light-harvesting protein [Rhodobium]MBB4301765.1 light-harvesting protein B-800-850 alpha chain [Rhodobium orientis]MBK5950567.1 hypothetical protein [Rhodobium orientis]RAI28209.1 hypothetical protein CH339_07645 [Rhodobium orientis]